MSRYVKKQMEVEAFQYDGDLIDKEGYYYVPDWAVVANANGTLYFGEFEGIPGQLTIKTLEGDMHVTVGDYVIRGIKGELYPCKAEIFEKLYDPVVDPDKMGGRK